MKLLFICNQNKNRSKTAESIFRNSFETKSAGLFCKSPINKKQFEWADLIVVMEDFQRTELSKRFPKQYMRKRIISLEIADIYSYGQQELKNLLKSKLKDWIPSTHQIVS